ncbi:uncharacterized protein LOC144664479 isoform X2 [Oculina patagonica]
MKVLPYKACFAPLFVVFVAFRNANSTSFKDSIDVADGILVYANFFPFPHHKLNSTPVESRAVSGEQDCIAACTESSQCRSLNFKPVPDANGKFICHLLDTDKFNSSELFNASLDFHHYSFTAPCELSPCQNGGTCYPVNGEYDFKCKCVPSHGGKQCEKSWTMVFKMVSGVSADIYQLWSSAYSLNENKTVALNVNLLPKEHYKNRFVQNWQTANPKEARVALYNDEAEVLSIVFNATASNNESWFSRDRLIHSPWTDLYTEPLLTFAIQGSCCGRSFYIIRNHGGCAADAGWLLVSSGGCAYENRLPKPTAMYSNHTNYTNWNAYENVGIADVLLVYIR